MAYGTINAEQLTTQSGYTLGAGNASSFKNRIINGAMVISQRSASDTVTAPASSSYVSLDRWRTECVGGGFFSIQRSTVAPTGFTNSALITTTTADGAIAAGDYYDFQQLVEGFNVADLGWGTASAQSVTLSFWVRSSVTGTFAGSFTNSAGNRSYVFTYSISAANTFEYKTITIAGDTSGTWLTDSGRGVCLSFDLGNGSSYQATAGSWVAQYAVGTSTSVKLISTINATWYITGVQLEVGTVATSFDYRPYGTELALCYRYYRRYASSGGAYTAWGPVGVTAGSTSFSRLGFPLDIPMRTAPTVGFSSCIGWNGVIGGAVTVGNTYSSINNVDVDVNTSGITSTVGLAAKVLMSGSSAYVELTGAEL
jgi:hypothetical protein